MNPKKKSNDSSFSQQELLDLAVNLKCFGYLLPADNEDLAEYEKIYGEDIIPLPNHLESGDFLSERDKHDATKVVSFEAKAGDKGRSVKSDYFKKIVLAAEIAYQLHDEPTFGHKKFVKLQYLCEQTCNMNLSTQYNKYAAGPLDPKLMYSIDAEFKKQKWFKIVKRESFGFKYELMEDSEKYKKYFANYFGQQADDINYIINIFRKEKSDFCEIVATLFYVWREYLDTAFIVNDEALIQGFYQWDESKKRFSKPTLERAIAWMTTKGIVPKT